MRQFIAILVLILSTWAFAQEKGEPRIISRSNQVFENINCAETNTCDLKKVRFKSEDYQILVDGGIHYGTRLFAHYLTDTVGTLENYAFVQFIKGCQYNSYDTGEITPKSIAREYFNELATYSHKNWVIDSIDTNPIYFSNSEFYHFFYKWNDKQEPLIKNIESPYKLYGLEKPVYPELYVTDRPGTAFYVNGGAKNISLAFKTCLYKTSDIPKEASPEDINFAEPIHCYYWYSSWIYDHEERKFNNPYSISPVCNN